MCDFRRLGRPLSHIDTLHDLVRFTVQRDGTTVRRVLSTSLGSRLQRGPFMRSSAVLLLAASTVLATAACHVQVRTGEGANAPTNPPPPQPTVATTNPTPAPTATASTANTNPPTTTSPVAHIRMASTARYRGAMKHVANVAHPAVGQVPTISGSSIFGSDQQAADSLQGFVYSLPPNTQRLPDLGTLKPELALFTRQFTSAPQEFRGFSYGGALHTNDFAIRYDGTMTVAAAGSYWLAIGSEDGARVYVDGQLVLDNDGLRGVHYQQGTFNWTAGRHTFRLEYFKGSGTKEVALELWLRTPTMPNGSATMWSPTL